MDLDKLEAYAKHGDMGPYSTQFVELITLIRKQEAALQAATTQEIRAVASSSAPSVATVDTPELVKLMSFWADSDPGPEALEKYQAVIAHIDAHVSAQVAEERLRADNADGMAECMCMFRDDMISAGIITDSVAPMFMSEAILRIVAAKDAEIKTLTAALDAQGELTDRYQEIALSAQAAAPMAYLRFRAARQWSGVGGSDIEYAEWYETCQAHEIGDDKKPAFPVYAVPQPSPAPVAMTDEQIDSIRALHFNYGVVSGALAAQYWGNAEDVRSFASAILAAQQEAV